MKLSANIKNPIKYLDNFPSHFQVPRRDRLHSVSFFLINFFYAFFKCFHIFFLAFRANRPFWAKLSRTLIAMLSVATGCSVKVCVYGMCHSFVCMGCTVFAVPRRLHHFLATRKFFKKLKIVNLINS